VALPMFGFKSVGSRFLFAFALVVLTWNPTRFNYVAWMMAQFDPVERSDLWPLVAFSGIVMLAGWIFFLRTTAQTLGTGGIVLFVGLSVVVFWALFKYNIVSSGSTTLIAWIVLVLFAAMLATGMSWAHLRKRWSGQATVDEVDQR
jgi:uncharacterized protein DUF6524